MEVALFHVAKNQIHIVEILVTSHCTCYYFVNHKAIGLDKDIVRKEISSLFKSVIQFTSLSFFFYL